MLDIYIDDIDLYDEQNEKFIHINSQHIYLEHSLVSISKWESIWKIPFINKKEKTKEQILSYIKCMLLTKNIGDYIYQVLNNEQLITIMDYINDSMTATSINETMNDSKSEVITSEIIYYWIIKFNIPICSQHWHLNRLLTLIRVCGIKESPDKKIPTNEILNKNRELNELRKREYNTKG